MIAVTTRSLIPPTFGVWQALCEIPRPASTKSYTDIAQRTGSPNAVRAVGERVHPMRSPSPFLVIGSCETTGRYPAIDGVCSVSAHCSIARRHPIEAICPAFQ